MKLIDGKAFATAVRAQVKKDVEKFEKQHHPVGLTIVRVGNDPASSVYVKNKLRACEECGIQSKVIHLSAGCGYGALRRAIECENGNPYTSGLILQLPLPVDMNASECSDWIHPSKDVDGFTSSSVSNVARHGINAPLPPCTPAGIMELLFHTLGNRLDGAHAVVIGRSDIVGKPMAQMLLHENCTVTVCHSHTQDLESITRQADILVSAVGKPRFVKADMVKEGATVIDVGINRLPDGTLCGDVDFDSVKDVADFLTPVPGGVGPMTVAMLMKNTVTAALRQIGKI